MIGAVTGFGMRLREMRPLLHRGQALLLLVVGVLAGLAVAGVCLERGGIPDLQIGELFAQPKPGLPAQITIGRGVAPSDDGGLAGTPRIGAAPAVAATPSPQPQVTASVVPATVYAYPPDSHRHGGAPDTSGGGHGGG